MSLSVGTRLGPYEILGPLGSGGMGEVYKARDTRLDRVVAVKTSKDQFTQRFEREARTAAALNHPNICHLYDVGPNYLVMEYVEGAPIRPTDNFQRLLEWAMQIADGLATAHAAGVVHRDLKPGNILIARSGQVKILDFGLAMLGSDDSDVTRATHLTDVGTTVGTAAYMSPEQARGHVVDARTDLWSLGVVLYEMATGVRPFDGATTPVIFEALLSRAPVPVRERNPRVPPELERIIDRLLEKDRETRYQSAADLRADLRRVERDSSSGKVVADPRSSESPRVTAATTAGALRSRRAYAAAVILLALLVLAGGVGLFYSTRPSSPATSPSEYVQLTNFTDSATAPALSPDGRMVTFIRGGEFFLSRGQIYVKLLPNGESVRLTNDADIKYGPVFTPDGSRIAYSQVTRVGTSMSWDTWTVPVLGGQPTRLLPNASGLVWMNDQRVLFSEIKGAGLHMGIVTATESRADEREIYFPAHERAMAHFSYASPDRASVLIVEMDRTATFQPCRQVPFDGSSPGRQVGPPGVCTSAAWSPDGKWMYFGANVRGSSHLWRQKVPGGTPDQITFGPTEEEGVAVAPDGRSLITSVGTRRSTIWIHDAAGERPISSEGYAAFPRLSGDGKRVFYLLRQDGNALSAELRSVDLASGKSDSLLPGMSVVDYDISPDEKEVVFTTQRSGESQIWLASLDRRSAPRQITPGGDEVSFGANGELIFRQLDKQLNFLYRINRDGTGGERITSAPILNKFGVSPDGQWVAAFAPRPGEGASSETVPTQTIAVPVHGGTPRKICDANCPSGWSSNGRFLAVQTDEGSSANAPGKMLLIPLRAGQSLPDLPASGIGSAAVPGARVIEHGFVSFGQDQSIYVFQRTELQRNLFRIPLH